MDNKYYYLSALENAMSDFLDKETEDDNSIGWFGDNLARHMAEAAFAVLSANKDLNDFFTSQDMLKK